MVKKLLKKLMLSSLILNMLASPITSTIRVFAEDGVTTVSETDETNASVGEDTGSSSASNTENSSGAKSETSTKSDGTANGRVSTYINFAAGKTLDQTKLAKLNTDQLQFMGIFMSNMYTPWMTDFGTANDKRSKSVETNMANALKDYAGFDEKTAKTFATYLQGVARGDAKTSLKIRFSDSQTSKKYVSTNGKVSKVSATYADLLLLGSGYITNGFSSGSGIKEATENYLGSDFDETKHRYASIGWGEGSDFHPVITMDVLNKDNTASFVGFMKGMEMVDVSKGYGFAALDFKDGEIDVSEDQLAKLMEKIGEDKLAESSIYGAKLGVSAFGDLLWLGANHQYVIYPSAMNPYTWQRTDSSGKDFGKAGNALNVANAQLLTEIGENKLGSVGKSDKSTSSTNYFYLNPADGKPYDTSQLGTFMAGDGIVPFSWLKAVQGNSKSVNDLQDFWSKTVTSVFQNSKVDNFTKLIKGKFIEERGLEKHPDLAGREPMMPVLQYASSDGVNLMGGIALLDTSGSYSWSSDTGDSKEDSYGKTDDEDGIFRTIQKSDIIKASGDGFEDAFGKVQTSSFTWGNSYKSTSDQGYAKIDSSETAQDSFKYLYATYAIAAFEKGKFADGSYLGYRLNTEGLPKITGKSIKLSEEDRNDLVTKSIRDWLYYLLHPTSGFRYFVEWSTNKIKAFMIDWHNDMVGTEGVGVLPGTTRYIGFSGYVTTPELSDMAWTDAMVNWYKSITIYLIIFIVIIMVMYVVLGLVSSIQKALLGIIIFSVFVYSPVIIVKNSINLSNKFANFVFGNKFSYWGIVQQQAYFAELADSIDSSNSTYKNYLLDLYDKNASESGNQGGDNIVLRWQAPKKMSNLIITENEKKSYSDNLTDMISVITDGKSRSETFTSNTASTYFYRSYTDLANVSMFMYGDMVSNGQARSGVSTNTTSENTSKWSNDLAKDWSKFTEIYTNDRSEGYGVSDSSGSKDGSQAYRVRLPLSGNIYSDASSPDKQGTIGKLKLGEYVGLDQRLFKFSIAQLNTNQDLIKELSSGDYDASNNGKYTNEDIKSLAAYGVMSENPFYYFSWDLYDQGLASNPTSNDGFRQLLLSKADSGYFLNSGKNNEMRDYLDMRTLFTYIIPYLKQGNDLVREWDKTYGIFFYDGVTYEEGHEKDTDIATNPELAQKYWHNVNVARLYNIYTPWVDLLYDTSSANKEKISYQGETYTVSDPIDPSTYPKERPMVFSKSEMYDYGLKEDQLTSVERKIMKVSEKVMPRWVNLLNYYNFTDVALNTSAAMEATFVFNSVFSESKIAGESVNLYPQSFELKNFTYDAFLRMIISNSTGESLTADEGENGSIYERIIKHSSITTGLVLLVLDVLANYTIPLVKLVIIIALFISCILVIIFSALSVNDDIGKETVKKVAKSTIVPAIQYLGVSILMSWVVSLFMGNGNTSVTGYDGKSIVIGDPTVTLICMLCINIVVMIAYWKVLVKVWGTLKEHGGNLGGHLGGIVAGTALLAGAAIFGIGKGAKSVVGGTLNSGKSALKGTGSAITGASRLADEKFGITASGFSRRQARLESRAQRRKERALWKSKDIKDRAKELRDKDKTTNKFKKFFDRGSYRAQAINDVKNHEKH